MPEGGVRNLFLRVVLVAVSRHGGVFARLVERFFYGKLGPFVARGGGELARYWS